MHYSERRTHAIKNNTIRNIHCSNPHFVCHLYEYMNY
jgi:hypothetical protein